MTYCVALKLDEGLVCLSDTRTNAGIDNVSRYKKTFTWEGPDRAICLMSAGNLSITQGVIDQLETAVAVGDDPDADATHATVMNVPTLFRLAEIVGAKMHALIEQHAAAMEKDGASSGASIIVAGQIAGEPPRLFLVYSAGNFIECGSDTPYFQIGEAKYGKPVIDYTVRHDTDLTDGVRTALVSMASTVRSNLSVAAPLDLSVIRADEHRFALRRRINEDDSLWRAIAEGWPEAMEEALHRLPSVEGWLSA